MYLHGAVGVVFVIMAFFGILEGMGHGVDRLRFLAPLTASVGGLVVLAYVGAHHLGHAASEGETVDGAHWLIGAVLGASGAAVAWGRLRLRSSVINELAAPFSSIFVAALFLVHGVNAGLELVLHAAAAAILVLSALAHFAVILSGDESRALRLFSALLLAVGGLALILYDAHPQVG